MKFVLFTPPKKVFSMYLENEIYVCKETEPELMRTFESEAEAAEFQQKLREESGRLLNIGFLDYMDEIPFVEGIEFLQRD